jgi:predicted nuclease of predicted toxin-antitoxin system
MRLLLDGCVPRPLGRALPEHTVRHTTDLGWDDLDDGPLLDRMGRQFEALITTDKSLPFQQQLATRAFGVVVLRAPTNRLQDLLPLIPLLRAALPELRPGEVRVLGA